MKVQRQEKKNEEKKAARIRIGKNTKEEGKSEDKKMKENEREYKKNEEEIRR
jgi:hypothetical protein